MLVNSPSAFSAWVRSRRIRTGYTQEQLAETIGMSRRWVQQVETGKVIPTLAAVIKLADALGVELRLEEPASDGLFERIFEGLE